MKFYNLDQTTRNFLALLNFPEWQCEKVLCNSNVKPCHAIVVKITGTKVQVMFVAYEKTKGSKTVIVYTTSPNLVKKKGNQDNRTH